MNTTASGAQPKLTRKSYLIDRGFQLKYTVLLVAAGALICALFGAMMYLVHLDSQRGLVAELSRLTPTLSPELALQLRESEVTLVSLIVVTTLLMASALGLFGVLVTHRVAGPVYVMSRYIGTLAQGRFPLMRGLRRNDELKSFFERFQSAVETLRQRELEEVKELEEALAVLNRIAGSGDGAQAVAKLEKLTEQKRVSAQPVAPAPLKN